MRDEFKVERDGNGRLHKIDGPAIQYDNGDGTWYFHGKNHRIDGPAVDWPSKNYFVYYIHRTEYSEEVFYRITKNLKVFL
jgi:hypothetical protein